MSAPKCRWVWKNDTGLPGGRRGWYFETDRSVPHAVLVRLTQNMLPRIRQMCDSVRGSRREEWQMAGEILAQWVNVEQTVLEAGKMGLTRAQVEREIYGEPTFAWLREQLKTYSVAQHVHSPRGAAVYEGSVA